MNEKDRNEPWKERLSDIRNRKYLFAIGFGLLMILYFLVPFYSTHMDKETDFLSGFVSLRFLQDRQDFLYYASVMNVFSLSFSFLLFLFGCFGFAKEKKQSDIAGKTIPALFVLKILSDLLMLVFSFLTSTNVKPTLGSECEIGFSILFFVFYLLIYYPGRKNRKEDSQK